MAASTRITAAQKKLRSRILIVEDNAAKQAAITRLLQREFDAEVEAVASILAAYPNLTKQTWDLVILDMAFQVFGQSSSGDNQALAGLELLQYMSSKEISFPVIVATQHGHFSQPGYLSISSIEELDEVLTNSFPRIYRGVVSVDLASESWHHDFIVKVRSALNAK
jgi:CheY-like chemotaxis protein